jgi:hypothetical protein
MKGGLMIRDSLAANSKHFSIFVTGNGNGRNPCCQFRTENGKDSNDDSSGQTFISNRTNIRLKIIKTGNVLRAYYKRESDVNFLAFPEQQINFSSDSFFVGIAVTSQSYDYMSELRVAGDLVLSASDHVLPRAISTNEGTNCYNASDAYSASFDTYSLDLIIDDATDEDQCRNTREKLGFDRDYPFDMEVRDEYHDLMCQGVEFTAVDHLTSGLSEPPVFEEVEFEAPEYPDDPELTFETLSTHTFAWPGLYSKGTMQGEDIIVNMGQSIISLSFTAKYAEMAYTYAKDKADSACNAQPSLACVAVIAGNGGCLMIPSKYACEVAKLSLTNLFFALWKIAQLAVDTLEHAFYIVSQ